MFTRLNKQGVESDRGFAVQSLDRFTVEYREGNKRIALDVDNGISGGRPCVSVERRAFKRWDSMRDCEELSLAKQNEILQNFVEAMEFQGVAVVIEAQ